MQTDTISNSLGFTQTWRDLGIISNEEIATLENEWKYGNDKNAEHFRHGAFRRFLAAHKPLPPETSRALYDLGNQDPDTAMGGAIMAAIVILKECPLDIVESALYSPRPDLKRFAEKWFAVKE